ncbi:MAG: hypothetical protein H8E60_07800 [Candidatus Marinimicrobia bacterium]|nr:hypothetical protein [Candidatus Neomarinimicrobiota bacterium]
MLFFSCDVTEPDTIPPTIIITSPIESILTGISTIKVNASDNEEIVNVTFIINGLIVFEDSQSPYEYEWDVCAYDNTQHTLLVKATDDSGNVGQSNLLTFTTNAIYDCADVCAGNSEILTYWFDADTDSLGAGESSEYCEALVEEGWVLNNNDNDDNCLSNVHDCLGECDGNAIEDMCGTCDNDTTNDCIQDCAGVWGGTHWESDCGCVSINSSCVTDIDGNSYETVVIGNQEWMTENLTVTHYSNGDTISTGYSNSEWADLDVTETGAYSVYHVNDNNASQNSCGNNCADVYGNLYNWYAVDDSRGVCPIGWHVPTDDQYKELEIYLGMSLIEADDWGWRGTNEGSKLAGNANLWYDDVLINNTVFGISGFIGIPSGYRNFNSGNHNGMGIYSYFWSSSEYDGGDALTRILFYYSTNVYRNNNNKQSGFSVRCLKD